MTLSKFASLFNEGIWSVFFYLIVVMALSIGIQSLVFWLGNLGFVAGLYAVLIITLLEVQAYSDSKLFPFKGTSVMGAFYYCLIWLAVIGVYVCIIFPTPISWIISACFFGLLVVNWIGLECVNTDMTSLSLAIGVALCYCLGTYFTMLIFGHKPAVGIIEIIVLAVTALVIWFRPWFD